MSSEKIISEATPVRIGLVILFLGVFGSFVWWASGTSSKLDSILTNQTATGSTISEMKTGAAAMQKEVADLTLRVAIIESRSAPEPSKR